MRFSATILFSTAVLTVFLGGCGLFDTREPDNPIGSANPWIPPADPGGVLDNISLYFNLHDGLRYMKSFAEEGSVDSAFRFHPDQTSTMYDTSYFSDWGYYSEQNFILQLLSADFLPADSFASIQFIPESEPPGLDKPVFREGYVIEVHHIQNNIPTYFEGKADIQFDLDDSGVWVIINWWDERSGDNPTFSELKSTISN
jgi:hypothetical protein